MVCVTRAWDHRIVRDTSLELYMSFRRHCPSCCQWGDCFRIFLFIKHLVIYLLITVPSSMCRHSINIKRVMEKSYWKLGNYCKLKTLPVFGISISRRQNCGGLFCCVLFLFQDLLKRSSMVKFVLRNSITATVWWCSKEELESRARAVTTLLLYKSVERQWSLAMGCRLKLHEAGSKDQLSRTPKCDWTPTDTDREEMAENSVQISGLGNFMGDVIRIWACSRSWDWGVRLMWVAEQRLVIKALGNGHLVTRQVQKPSKEWCEGKRKIWGGVCL